MSEDQVSHTDFITCAYYDVSELGEPILMARGMELLPWEQRRKQVERYRFGRDRRLCLGAGLLAASLLREAGARDLSLDYGPYGKPFLPNHPHIHFNISHSGNLAVCAVASDPVGVDVETVAYHGREVAEYCMQPQELAWLNAAADPAHAFTRLWVRKESYIKLLGTGLSREPKTICVLPGEPLQDGATFLESNVEGAILCICTIGKRKVRYRRWSMESAQ